MKKYTIKPLRAIGSFIIIYWMVIGPEADIYFETSFEDAVKRVDIDILNQAVAA